MNWLRNAIRNWLLSSSPEVVIERTDPTTLQSNGPSWRMSVINAANGRIIELGTFKPNPVGPDWTYIYYLVQEDERLATAIERALVIKNLEA